MGDLIIWTPSNLWLPGPIWPKPKWHLHWLSPFCTDDHSVPIFHNRTPLPQKLPLPMGDLDPIWYMVSWAHPSPQTQTASR